MSVGLSRYMGARVKAKRTTYMAGNPSEKEIGPDSEQDRARSDAEAQDVHDDLERFGITLEVMMSGNQISNGPHVRLLDAWRLSKGGTVDSPIQS